MDNLLFRTGTASFVCDGTDHLCVPDDGRKPWKEKKCTCIAQGEAGRVTK